MKLSVLLEEVVKKKPAIFERTVYRLPTQSELEDINNHNLSAQEVFDGFCYTLIGRGILDERIKQQIVESIDMLAKKYPDNNNYKQAAKKAQELKPRHGW